MIVTNWVAKIIVKFVDSLTKDVSEYGITIWPFIFIWPKKYATAKAIRHEMVHIEQWKRYWIVGFPFVYFYYHLKFGYWKNPLEIEAYKRQEVK